jgi:serine/threonine protein phosphatase PrpC
MELEKVQIRTWDTSTSSVQGLSHSKKDLPCQDSSYAGKRNGISCVVLADGAGSRRYSELGAALISQKTFHYMTDHFRYCFRRNPEALKKEISLFLQEELNKYAIEQDMKFRDLASTLLAFATIGNKYILFHIGDGLICRIAQEQTEIYSYPVNGEYLNSTFFTTTPLETLLPTVDFKRGILGNDTRGVLLMTDGTSDSLYNRTKKELAPACNTLIQWLHKVPLQNRSKLIETNLTKVIRKKTQDDCSLGVLIPQTYTLDKLQQLSAEQLQQILGFGRGQTASKFINITLKYLEGEETKTIAGKMKLSPLTIKKYIKLYNLATDRAPIML